MAKPRVIIADTDKEYIIPFQFKFAKDFFGQVDVEIITDREYFDALFLKPQKAEVLIVSESLYDIGLQRHNIANIFLMEEQEDREQTGDLNVSRLFKYTNVKEIFHEIISKSAAVLDMDRQQDAAAQIVVVTSASGGAGKTTVAMGMGACLAKNYKRVLYINASRLQSFQYMMDNQAPITSPDIYVKLADPKGKVYAEVKHTIRREAFSYLPPFKASLMSVGLGYSIYGRIAVSAKESGDFDFIIVDAENSFDENLAKLLDVADKVIIVVNQTARSVHCTNQFVSNINGIDSDKYVFVCNDFDKEKESALIRPDFALRFSVGDYIEHIMDYETKRITDYVKEPGIQKTTFLVL